MQVSVYVILFQNSLQVRHAVKYLSSYLRVWENPLVPIVLQGSWREEKPFTNLSPCEVDFAPE